MTQQVFINAYATPVDGYIKILSRERLPDGKTCVTVPCADHTELKTLPGLIDFEGERYARTGWNSDHCIAYYKTGHHYYGRKV